jgi:hypothetical protein
MDFDTEIKFQKLLKMLEPNFEMPLDLTALLFLIGINEVGFGHRAYTKQEKMDVLQVAICTLLSPAGYYQFSHRDDNNWPHFERIQSLPSLEEKEQQHVLKESAIEYCIANGYVDTDDLITSA